MNRILIITSLCLPLAAHPALADTAQQKSKQHQECSKEAGGMNIEVRPEFMWKCTDHATTQEPVSGSQGALLAKEKACTAEAKSQPKGAAREQYIQGCMKKK
jgi:hypothetical protein